MFIGLIILALKGYEMPVKYNIFKDGSSCLLVHLHNVQQTSTGWKEMQKIQTRDWETGRVGEETYSK